MAETDQKPGLLRRVFSLAKPDRTVKPRESSIGTGRHGRGNNADADYVPMARVERIQPPAPDNSRRQVRAFLSERDLVSKVQQLEFDVAELRAELLALKAVPR